MSEIYRKKIIKLLNETKPRLAKSSAITFKNSFGAVVGYIDDNLFIASGKFGIALKLPGQIITKLFEENKAKPLKYFEKGYVKKDYAVLSNAVLVDSEQIKKLINKSISFVRSKI